MLQQDKPDDYVIATGESHTVRELVEKAFQNADIPIAWEGSGVEEVGYDKRTNKIVVVIDPIFFRLTEVDMLQGDASKARRILGWKPTVSFDELIALMVKEDLALVASHKDVTPHSAYKLHY